MHMLNSSVMSPKARDRVLLFGYLFMPAFLLMEEFLSAEVSRRSLLSLEHLSHYRPVLA
jgi:hypothetical protein